MITEVPSAATLVTAVEALKERFDYETFTKVFNENASLLEQNKLFAEQYKNSTTAIENKIASQSMCLYGIQDLLQNKYLDYKKYGISKILNLIVDYNLLGSQLVKLIKEKPVAIRSHQHEIEVAKKVRNMLQQHLDNNYDAPVDLWLADMKMYLSSLTQYNKDIDNNITEDNELLIDALSSQHADLRELTDYFNSAVLKTTILHDRELLPIIDQYIAVSPLVHYLKAENPAEDTEGYNMIKQQLIELEVIPPDLRNPINSPTTAVKADDGKTRFDLLPVRPIEDIAKTLTFGATKYSDRNWEKGFEWSRVYAALQRHLHAWWGGQDLDPETGMSHLAHAGCCLMFLQEFEYTHPELDNRVKHGR